MRNPLHKACYRHPRPSKRQTSGYNTTGMSKFSPKPDPPHRIVFCITDLHVGGAERCLTELVTRLDRNRFSASVVSIAPRPHGAQSELVERLAATGIEPTFLGLRKRWQFPLAVSKLKRLLVEQQPALLQTFLFHANCVGATAARRAGIAPVVAGIRVADPRSRFRLWLERRLTRNVAAYACVSQAVAEFSARLGGLREDKLIVIPNGIDVDHVESVDPANLQQFNIPPLRRALLYVGRLDAQKRVDRVISVFTAIAESLPGHDLLIVGDGPERVRLERQSQQTSTADRIHFVGQRHDVPSVMKSCDLLLLTSQWEGMPNVLLEAMAVGIPVVTLDVEGVAEVLGSVAQQQLVATDGGEQAVLRRLGHCAVEIVGDQELARRLGQSNRQWVAEFSVAKMVDRYQEMFEHQINQARETSSDR